jgi:hypothetical protein
MHGLMKEKNLKNYFHHTFLMKNKRLTWDIITIIFMRFMKKDH